MGTPKFTEFGLCVKKRLLDLGMTQKELEQIISERTGLFVDTGYMYKILSASGRPRKSPKRSKRYYRLIPDGGGDSNEKPSYPGNCRLRRRLRDA